MTIYNFDWATFRYTIHTVNWYEAGMVICFILAGLASTRKSVKTGGIDGKSPLFIVLAIIGASLGVAFKLLAYLDVTTILYAALLIVAIADLVVYVRIGQRQARESVALQLQERRKALSGDARGEDERRSHHHRHHEHEYGSSSHSHGSHGHGHSHNKGRSEKDAAQNLREPLFEDPLADENKRNGTQ